MYNEIEIRKGPSFQFVLKEYQSIFEQNIIDIYMKKVEEDKLQYHVPLITDDIMFSGGTDPVVFAASYLSFTHKDLNYFKRRTEGMTDEQKHAYAIQVCQNFEMNSQPFYDDLMCEDILAVLNFHKMSFVDIEICYGVGYNEGLRYRNMPYRNIW